MTCMSSGVAAVGGSKQTGGSRIGGEGEAVMCEHSTQLCEPLHGLHSCHSAWCRWPGHGRAEPALQWWGWEQASRDRAASRFDPLGAMRTEPVSTHVKSDGGEEEIHLSFLNIVTSRKPVRACCSLFPLGLLWRETPALCGFKCCGTGRGCSLVDHPSWLRHFWCGIDQDVAETLAG